MGVVLLGEWAAGNGSEGASEQGSVVLCIGNGKRGFVALERS